MYQAISRSLSIGAQSDFLQCTNRGQESWFEPSVVAFGAVVGPLLAQSHIWRQSAASKTGPSAPASTPATPPETTRTSSNMPPVASSRRTTT